MKSLTTNDVQLSADKLIAENKTTTNLDIKIDLRSQGFHATQEAVAKFMNELVYDNKYEFDFNGKYRTYYKQDQNSNRSLSDMLKQQNKSTNDGISPKFPNGIQYYQNRKGETIIALEFHETNPGDYKVWSTLVQEVLYFSGEFTRDKVRQAYSSIIAKALNCSSTKLYPSTRVKTLK